MVSGQLTLSEWLVVIPQQCSYIDFHDGLLPVAPGLSATFISHLRPSIVFPRLLFLRPFHSFSIGFHSNGPSVLLTLFQFFNISYSSFSIYLSALLLTILLSHDLLFSSLSSPTRKILHSQSFRQWIFPLFTFFRFALNVAVRFMKVLLISSIDRLSASFSLFSPAASSSLGLREHAIESEIPPFFFICTEI